MTASGARRSASLGATGYTESVRVEVVELPVTVFDREGKLVTGLPRDAFRVFEDGKEVPLEAFATTEELPLALGILVDTSGSMLEEFPEVRQAVGGFASRLLRPGDRYFLMTFAFEPRMQLEWATDPQGLVGALERVTPEGGTALFDAVVRALELFRGRRGRSALVLLSDGDDNSSRASWDVTLRYARTVRVPIFTIGYRISKLDFLIRERLKDHRRCYRRRGVLCAQEERPGGRLQANRRAATRPVPAHLSIPIRQGSRPVPHRARGGEGGGPHGPLPSPATSPPSEAPGRVGRACAGTR